MALRVINAPAPPKLTVTNNYGFQNTAPAQVIQPAAPAKVVQPAAPSRVIQPAAPAKVVQPAASAQVVQPVATAAQIAAAAEQVRQAAIAEAARQKQVKATQTTIALKVATQQNKTNLVVSNYQPQKTLKVSTKYDKSLFQKNERTQYDNYYDQEYKTALDEYNALLQADKKRPFWQKLGDKVTFGQDFREKNARGYSTKMLKEISDSVVFYDSAIKDFLNEQARRKAAIEGSKFSTQEQFDKAVADFSKWESGMIDYLERSRARLTARSDLFGVKSEAPLSSKTARATNWALSTPKRLENNPLWKYTLGSGSKNIPSLVTLPSRAVNFVGNLNTKDRNIYKYGGETSNRSGSNENAWQATLNQRNFNIRPYTDKPFNKDDAKKLLEGGRVPDDMGSGSVQRMLLKQKYERATSQKEKDELLKQAWDEYNRANRNLNSVQEFVADPLTILGGVVKGAKSLGYLDKVSDFTKASKAGSFASKVLTTVGESKAIKWLTAESKTPNQVLGEAIDTAKASQSKIQNELFDEINIINKRLIASEKIDLTIFDKLRDLSDSEAKILQRMKDGKLSPKDRLALAGRGMAPVRKKLEEIAISWTDFTEKMKLADNIVNTRFGASKQLYSPRTTWLENAGKTLDDYDFRLKKKIKGQQGADDFYRGAVDRYFASQLDDFYATNQNAKRSSLISRRKELLDRYDVEMSNSRSMVDQAYKKTQSKYNKLKNAAGFPTRLWKKSVLKFRPAWTVNNAIYNTQAAALAGGADALIEQFKMLNPRYWRKAMDESRHIAGSNLGKEIGTTGKLNRFNTAVEDWSRVAAYRSNIKKGLSSDQSLKRVNKYLFDYKIRNFERPLKAVMPFYGFQKNLAKAAVSMPFDRPLAAKAYNSLDRYQQEQFDKDFETIVPQLKDAGYSDEEINAIREENAKYFRGKLKIGNKYYNTPFNAFSEKGLTTAGINPYLAAAQETIANTDQFGRPQKNTKFWEQIIKKFPQADLVKKRFIDKPTKVSWIGKAGSEGYGLSKEKQGFDKSKSNYDRNMDPTAKFNQDVGAFVGVPRSMQFDKNKLVENKVLQKVTDEYFSTDWKSLDFQTAEQKRQNIFKKYGITADDFYKGILAKYDTDTTKQVKKLKEDASKLNKSLFEEYSKQPKGTRSAWAVNKLRELNDSGYFNDNPFLKSFDWLKPDTVAKQDKKAAYEYAKKTGDWSKYTAKYGTKKTNFTYDGKYFKSAESMEKYKKHKFFEKYLATNDAAERRKMMRENPQYAKRIPKTESEIVTARFWNDYYKSDKETRKKLLAENQQYNTRKDWTTEQWNKWRSEKRFAERQKIKNWGNTAKVVNNFAAIGTKEAQAIIDRRLARRNRKSIKWLLPA